MSTKSRSDNFSSELKNIFFCIFTGHTQDMSTQNCKEMNHFPMVKLILITAKKKKKKKLLLFFISEC